MFGFKTLALWLTSGQKARAEPGSQRTRLPTLLHLLQSLQPLQSLFNTPTWASHLKIKKNTLYYLAYNPLGEHVGDPRFDAQYLS